MLYFLGYLLWFVSLLHALRLLEPLLSTNSRCDSVNPDLVRFYRRLGCANQFRLDCNDNVISYASFLDVWSSWWPRTNQHLNRYTFVLHKEDIQKANEDLPYNYFSLQLWAGSEQERLLTLIIAWSYCRRRISSGNREIRVCNIVIC